MNHGGLAYWPGARAFGEPCYDPDSRCADPWLLVNLREIDAS
jgi:hypothetical protein